MYISRSDWREFVERLDACERQKNENGYLILKYQAELDRARIALAETVGLMQNDQRLLEYYKTEYVRLRTAIMELGESL